MGIDKTNVRFVFHNSFPKTIDGYYQGTLGRTGRAGRDGLKSTCILFYLYADKMRWLKLIEENQQSSSEMKDNHKNNLNKMINYCENLFDCRRAIQLNHFEEFFLKCSAEHIACDNCRQDKNRFKKQNVTEAAKIVVEAVRELNDAKYNITIVKLVRILFGLKVKTNSTNQDFSRLKCFGYFEQKLLDID